MNFSNEIFQASPIFIYIFLGIFNGVFVLFLFLSIHVCIFKHVPKISVLWNRFRKLCWKCFHVFWKNVFWCIPLPFFFTFCLFLSIFWKRNFMPFFVDLFWEKIFQKFTYRVTIFIFKSFFYLIFTKFSKTVLKSAPFFKS